MKKYLKFFSLLSLTLLFTFSTVTAQTYTFTLDQVTSIRAGDKAVIKKYLQDNGIKDLATVANELSSIVRDMMLEATAGATKDEAVRLIDLISQLATEAAAEILIETDNQEVPPSVAAAAKEVKIAVNQIKSTIPGLSDDDVLLAADEGIKKAVVAVGAAPDTDPDDLADIYILLAEDGTLISPEG